MRRRETKKFNLSNKITRKMVEILLKNLFWENISPEDLEEKDQEKFERILNFKLKSKLIEIHKKNKSVFIFQDKVSEVRNRILSEYTVSELKKYVSENEALNIINKFKEFTSYLKYSIYDTYSIVSKESKLPIDELLDKMDNLEI